MARPREFDEARALDAAMRTFWEKGYESTSTQDLCEATGLGRSSIYNTFTSKRDLFLRSLEHYVDTMTGTQVAVLEDESSPPLERLRTLLDLIVDGEIENRSDGRAIGCLTVNTTVELSGRDPDVTRLLERDLARRLAAFRAVISAGQRGGDIASERDADALARFLNAVIGGMRVSAQGGADRATLEAIAATTLDALAA
ncbi:TetR/AcrR family transcriptional regulator [Streptomyces macrosporus]|uniref:TetR/AcrR family transcriptional regulator n=1 Tax=Streptomyces macrosporus TaxID=44032 RepID=A0ABN3J7F8_9ACTN